MICLNNLRYRALEIDTLLVDHGITSIIGKNGSGKTTLLKLCAGISEPESGSILIDGKSPRNEEIGWVNEFPDRNILFETVHDEIASSLRFRRMPCSEIETRVRTCMESMGITALKTRSMRELSGGEKIVVSLAAALVLRPRVLILDEYDSHLDADLAARINSALQKSHATYVLRCTQDMETAAISDTVIFLREGKIEYAGDPERVFSSLTDTPFYPFSWRCRR
jgi:energy-coupling factor transport system ATP-binding protein